MPVRMCTAAVASQIDWAETSITVAASSRPASQLAGTLPGKVKVQPFALRRLIAPGTTADDMRTGTNPDDSCTAVKRRD